MRVSLPTTVDDAYITYTFSKNVARGHGPLYGHGVVVEGYSNFLWMLIVALGWVIRPDANPVVVARVFGVPFVLVMAVAAYRLCRERTSRPWSLGVVALLLVNSDVVTGFQFGLETVPYAALLTLAFSLYVRSLHTPGLRRWVVPAFVAAALMRTVSPNRGWEYVRDESLASGTFLVLPLALFPSSRERDRPGCDRAVTGLVVTRVAPRGRGALPLGRMTRSCWSPPAR